MSHDVHTPLSHPQLKAYEEDAVIAGYVLAQEGRKWNKMWYQIKRDCVIYKFKAHEVRYKHDAICVHMGSYLGTQLSC